MILQTYVYIILAILGTLALFSLVYVLVFKLKNEDAAFFTEEEISEDVKDMRAKLEYIAGIMGRLPNTPHYHSDAALRDELLEVMKDGRHCIVFNCEELGNRLDFICDVLEETPAGKRVMQRSALEHPELFEEPKEEWESEDN